MAKNSSTKPASPTVTILPEKLAETLDTIPTEYLEMKREPTVIWRIQNVSFWEPDLHGRDILSSEFVLRGICSNTWQLHLLRPRRVKDLSTFVVVLRPSRFVESVGIDAEWTFVRVDGSILRTIVSRYEPTHARSAHSLYMSTPSDEMNYFNAAFLQDDILTIRLRVWKRGETSNEEEEQYLQLVTRFLKEPTVKEKFIWRIQNFSALRRNSGITTTVYMRGEAFRLSCFLRGAHLDEASVGFSISTESTRDKGMQVTINLVSESNETPVKIVETKLRFTPAARSQTWVLPDLMPRQKILTEYLEKDVLVLSCGFLFDIGSCLHSYIEECCFGHKRVKTLDYRADGEARQTRFTGTILSVISDQEAVTMLMPFSCEVVPPAALELFSSQNILLCDLRNLFTKKTLSDIELRSENRSYAVHKNILCARSAVFEEMFCGDMKAASSMDVPDLDCETLGHFLFFLYTGTLEHLQWKDAMKLYEAALQYRVRSLKDECRGILMSGINLTNAADIFEMADRVQDQELRSSTFDFIQYNFDAVVLSDEWGKFQERSFLAGKTMKEIYKYRKHARTVR